MATETPKLPALLLPFICLLTSPQSSSCSLTLEEKELALKVHNQLRKETFAANMQRMAWDSKLEEVAKKYVAKCIWAHNPLRNTLGENMFAITEDLNVKEAIKAWYAEIVHFSIEQNKCVKDQVCGHYTQIVWATTNRLACARKFCLRMKNVELPHANLFLCNYSPMGNERGKEPYMEGLACTACPKNYFCENQFCTNESIIGVIDENPTSDGSNHFIDGKSRPIVLTFVMLTVWFLTKLEY